MPKNKRYILKYPGIGDLRVDAYIDCGPIIEAVSIHDDGEKFDHISLPSNCIIIDQEPPFELADFLAEEATNEARIRNVRRTRKAIQAQADKQLEELPEIMAKQIVDAINEDKKEPEGYR
jgi:hypothetical protein